MNKSRYTREFIARALISDIEKWKLFSLYAKQNKGGLFIVAPENRLIEIKDKVKESHINNIHLIYITEKN